MCVYTDDVTLKRFLLCACALEPSQVKRGEHRLILISYRVVAFLPSALKRHVTLAEPPLLSLKHALISFKAALTTANACLKKKKKNLLCQTDVAVFDDCANK